MSFHADRFAAARPYLYHLTFRANLARLRTTRILETAADVAAAAGRTELLRTRRVEHVPVVLRDGGRVYLRDQAPLFEKNIEFTDGWTLPQLVEHLNRRVYFWPGTESGPIDYGRRHFERYRTEQPAIIRMPFRSIAVANSESRAALLPIQLGIAAIFGRPRQFAWDPHVRLRRIVPEGTGTGGRSYIRSKR